MKSKLFNGISVLFLLQYGMLIVWGNGLEAPGPEDDNDDSNEINTDGNLVGIESLCQNVSNRVFLPYVGDCKKYYLCWCKLIYFYSYHNFRSYLLYRR